MPSTRRLPRVCMGGSSGVANPLPVKESAPRVHGWFHTQPKHTTQISVCPACAWVVPYTTHYAASIKSLPRVCMGGSRLINI